MFKYNVIYITSMFILWVWILPVNVCFIVIELKKRIIQNAL